MSTYYLRPLKQFLHLIENRIPANIRIVAEIRLIWKEIVGEKMALRSQVAKCEYLPTNHVNSPNDFKRRLIVHVTDGETQTALTTYSSEYLEKIPKKYRIHSLRFYQTRNPLIEFNNRPIPQKPMILISKEDQQKIIDRVQSLHMSTPVSQGMIDYLITCKNVQYKNKETNAKK